MEKTNNIDQLRSLKSNANSANFEADIVSRTPPALQMKSESSSNQEEKVDVESENAPFQFVPADPGPPSIEIRNSAAPFQFKKNLNSGSEPADGINETQPYQLASEGNGPPAENPESGSADSTPNNTGLPTQLKSGVENLSGYSLDDVKVHYNSDKPAQLQAHAYAQGTDIHVASGQEKHLPHEAWHVVQQKQGRVKPTVQKKGIGINDDNNLEREADFMGAKALQLKSASKKTKSYSATNTGQDIAPFQLYSNVIQREKFDVDTSYASGLMNRSAFHVYCDLKVFLRQDGGSIDDMETIAELISALFPFPPETFSIVIEHSVAEIIQNLENEITRRFDSNRWRRYYLLSYLNSRNGTELGEPSFLARALLATGLISSLNVNSDLDYVISIFESANSEELLEFKNANILDYLIANLKVRSNYMSKATHITKAKIDYLEKHIQNKTTQYEVDLASVDGSAKDEASRTNPGKIEERKEDKDAEGLLLIKTITSKLGPWNKGKLLKKNSAVETIRGWANSLKDDERAYIQSDESTIYSFLNSADNIDQNYAAYLMSLFSSVEKDDDHTPVDEATADAGIFRAYLNSKRKVSSGGKKFTTMLEVADSMNHASRIKVLEDISHLTGLTSDYGKRQQALNIFSAKLDKLTNINRNQKALLLNAFTWGAEKDAALENGPLHKIQKIANNGSIAAEDYGKKLLPYVRQLNPADILQIVKSPLWSRLHYLKHGRGDTDKFRSVANLLGMSNEGSERIDPFARMTEDSEKKMVFDKVELRPIYWAEKIKLSIGDRNVMNKGKLRRNKNDILSIISQAFYAGERAAKKEPTKYEEVKDFTGKIIADLSSQHQGFLRSTLSSGYNALANGEPISASDRLDTAALNSVFKKVKGYKMKPSAVIQTIIDAQGLQLLNEWSDFPEFIDHIQTCAPESREAAIVTYIPKINNTLLSRMKESLPAEEFSKIHRDLLIKMSEALKKDIRFKEMLESVGVENLSIRGEMMKSLGLLNREQIVDTGWQLKYFSTRGPIRKEAKRIVLHRLRKAKKGTISDSDEIPDLEEALSNANENLKERSTAFEETKAKSIKAIVFTISIILGVLTTAGSLGLAGPLVAAGLPTLLVSFMASTIFTGIASSIKLAVEATLTGGSFNTAEGVMNVMKDVLMAATTVAAGQVGEKLMEGWKLTPAIAELFRAAEAEGASVGSKILYSFVEKFLAVSPVEVAMRNITELIFTNVTAVERSDREGIGLAQIGGFLRDFTIDALLKTTMDVIGTDMLGAVNADSSIVRPESAPNAGDALESIGPLLYKIEPHQVLYIIAAENFITSQNYSVAEQDSLIGNLLVDKAAEWATEKLTSIGMPDREHKSAGTSGSDTLTLKQKLERIPIGLIVEKFIDPLDYVNIVLSKNPGLANESDLRGLNVSDAKMIAIIKLFQARGIDDRKIKDFFGSRNLNTAIRQAVGMRIRRTIKHRRSRGPVDDADDIETMNPVFDGDDGKASSHNIFDDDEGLETQNPLFTGSK